MSVNLLNLYQMSLLPEGKRILCLFYLHCKDKIPKFRNKYSQKRNIAVSVSISTFICLWVIYIFPWSVCLSCWRKYVDRSLDYINHSQTHECGNWGWGHTIPRKGIHKWDFHCSVGGARLEVYARRSNNRSSDLHVRSLPRVGQDQKWLPGGPAEIYVCYLLT